MRANQSPTKIAVVYHSSYGHTERQAIAVAAGARSVVDTDVSLIKVEAVGANYYDTLVRSGAVSRSIPLPHVIGSDVVGHIEKLGADVKTLALGDRVIVAPGFPSDPASA